MEVGGGGGGISEIACAPRKLKGAFFLLFFLLLFFLFVTLVHGDSGVADLDRKWREPAEPIREFGRGCREELARHCG